MHMPNIILALFLLVEKFKDSSFWEPYIKALPSSYTTVMYFTPQQLEALKGSPIYGNYYYNVIVILFDVMYYSNQFYKLKQLSGQVGGRGSFGK